MKCQYIRCAAGMGVAGDGHCFLGGNSNNIWCDKFQDETKFLQKWRYSEIKNKFYELSIEAEKLPASEQQTKIVIMISELEKIVIF
jgi:hypothetical protein